MFDVSEKRTASIFIVIELLYVNAGTVQQKNSECYVGQFEGDCKTQLRKVVKEDKLIV